MEKKCKKSAQRLLALILCVAMLLPVFPQSVWAEELNVALDSAAALQAPQANALTVLGGLPYNGGSGSELLEYDCGNGVSANGAKSAIRIITGTDVSQFNTYCSTLAQNHTLAYTRDAASSTSSNNLYRKYKANDGSYSVYTYFLAAYNEVRIIVDTNQDTVQRYSYTPQTGVSVEPKMVQWGLSTSSSGYHIDTKTEANNTKRENNGSLTIIRMPDNSLFFHDGGILAQMSDEAAAELLAFCRELTGTTATREKMIINTWFVSHAHDDHFEAFTRFININHNHFDLKNIVYNIDIPRTLKGAGGSTTPASKDLGGALALIRSHYPDVNYYKPHTGETFNVAGVEFDVLYTHEDRLYPKWVSGAYSLSFAEDQRKSGSEKDIVDVGGTYRSNAYKHVDGYTDGTVSDFNDTSTVLKIKFPNNVTSILYADMNLAEQILWTIHPTSALAADIVMVPHHGFDAHANLVSYGKSKIYLYPQNYFPIFGTGVRTRDDLYNNFVKNFPGQTTPGGKSSDSYKIYWGGNETAIIDINALASASKSRDDIAECVETRPAMSFPYEDWQLDTPSTLADQTGIVSLSDFKAIGSGTAVSTDNKWIQFTPVGANSSNRKNSNLYQRGQYVIMSDAYRYIMSHDSTQPYTVPGGDAFGTDTAGSIVYDADGKSENSYYYNGNNVVLEHSDRHFAMWFLYQYAAANKSNNTEIAGGKKIAVLTWSNFGPSNTSDGTIYEGIELSKRTTGDGVGYWYSKNDDAGTYDDTRFLCLRATSTPFKGHTEYDTLISGNDSQGRPMILRYIIELLTDDTYLIYFKMSDDDFRVLYCDEYGNWGVKQYASDTNGTAKNKVKADLNKLKVRLYKYETLSKTKQVALSGYTTYTVSMGANKAGILAAIADNVVVSDPGRNHQHIPCSGTSASTKKVGYYYVDDSAAIDTSKPNGEYPVSIYYVNDNGTNTLVGTVKVVVESTGLDNNQTVYTSQNSDGFVYNGTAANSTVPTFRYNGQDIHLTVAMLVDSRGNGVDTSVSDTYPNLTVKFGGATIATGFTLVVGNGTIAPDQRTYPEPGSVTAGKNSTTSNTAFAGTGVANIELTTTAKPIEKGVDLIIIVDLSSSMRYHVKNSEYASGPKYVNNGQLNPNIAKENGQDNLEFAYSENYWKNTRMYAMEQALTNMVNTLSAGGKDVKIAMADFGDLDHYEFSDAVLDNSVRDWHFLDANMGGTGNLEQEPSNHLSFVLGKDDTTYGSATAPTRISQPYAIHRSKYQKNYNQNGNVYTGKILPKIYTGGANLDANAFQDVHTLNMENIVEEMRRQNGKLLGTNYDVGLETAYQLAYAKEQQNLANGQDREIVCIFMSDGAALQYNYMSGRTHSEAWSQAIIGETDEILTSWNDRYVMTSDYANSTVNQNPMLQFYLLQMWDFLRQGILYKENSTTAFYGKIKNTNLTDFFAAFQNATGETCSWDRFFKILNWNLHMAQSAQNRFNALNYYTTAHGFSGTDLLTWDGDANQDGVTDNGQLREKSMYRLVNASLRKPSFDANGKQYTYQTMSPYYYFYNAEGKSWWAEALKGKSSKVYPVINRFAKSNNTERNVPNYYYGEVRDKFSGDTTKDLALSGKDYVSGFKGLDVPLYTIGFSLGSERQISYEECSKVLDNIASGPAYHYEASTQGELEEALKSITATMVTSATGAYYTDTMGPEYDLSTTKTVTDSNGNTVTVNNQPQIRVLEYILDEKSPKLDASGNVIGYARKDSPVVREHIVFEANKFAVDGSADTISYQPDQSGTANGRVAYSSLVYVVNTDETTDKTEKIYLDIWDDKTGMINGRFVRYNTSKTASNKIDLTGDNVGDYTLAPETFFWTIGIIGETEMVLEYQAYLEGSMEGEKDYKKDVYPTNKSAILYYTDYIGNKQSISTVSPKFPWGGIPQISHGFYLVNERGNPIRDSQGNLQIVGTAPAYADITLNYTGAEGEKQYTKTSVDKIASELFNSSLGYELYNPDAYYTVVYNEAKNDNNYNSWTTTDTTNTTYVSINEGAYIKDTSGGADTPNRELNRTQVLFAVVQRTPDLVANKYVEAVDGSPNNFTLTLEAYTKFGACGLNSRSILKEVLTDYFVLDPSNVNAVKVYTYACTGFNNGEPSFAATGTELTGAKVNLSSSESSGRLDTIEISGFDYAANYLRANGNNLGCKLVVKVSIKTRDGFWGGNNVPTNEAETGIYNPGNGTPVVPFPIPKVNVPVDVKITAENKTYYYGTEGKKGSDLNPSITANGFKVTINNDDTLTPAEEWMAHYADIDWNSGSQKPSGSVDGKTPNNYTFSVTVKPKEPASDDSVGEDVDTKGKQDEDTSYVSILYPTLTFKDSTTVCNTPVAGYDFVENDYVSTQWVVTTPEGVPSSEVIPGVEGKAPELSLGFTPVDNVTNFTTDTKVDVTVTAKYEDGTQQRTEDITNVVTFKWQDDCDHKVDDVIDHNGSADSHEFWVHVVVDIVPDTVVIDFGLDVLIDVLANDSVPEGSVVAGVNSNDTVPAPSSEDPGFGSTATGDFGTISVVDNNKVQYSINTMSMNDADVFTYAVKDAVTQYYYYSTVTVIPATTIYYEDNFDGLGKIEYGVHSFIRGTTDKIDPPADVAWTYDELGDVQQAEDRPGTTAIDGIDADNLYGYDGSYTNMQTFSMGSARKFTTMQEVKENGDIMVTYGTAKFSFYGTGFDVISMTSGQTGTITIEVERTIYNEETQQDEVDRKTYAVDTYYGYAWKTDDEGKVVWYPVGNDTNALYQVPVMKVAGLEYDKYDVTITISYNDFFNHGQYKDEEGNKIQQYDFYLDAIRIYDPADDGANNKVIENAYKNDNEGWPEYFELRNMLIKANDFNASATDDVVPGVVFIDSTPELGSENGPKKHAISDYANYGPNNELYLAPGQSVAFELKMTGPVASIQLAAKSVGGTATAKCYLLGNETTNVLPDQLSTATDLYYNITSFNTPENAEENNVVVICNESESAAILSITNIKVTYTESFTQPASTKLTITRRSAEAVLNQLNSSVGEEDPGEVINGTIDIVGASLSFEDEILTNLYYTVSGIEATEMGLLTWSSEPANGTIENAENVYAGAQYIAEKDQYMVQTDGIAAKNLGDDIYMCVYAKTENGIVYSNVTKYSPKQYALSRLENSQNENMKALCVAMLNYGAAAQEYFGYKTEDLMNASLTAEQQALVSAYSADLFAGAVAADASKIGSFTKTEGFSGKSASVSFEGAFAINYYFAASAAVEGDMTFCYWSAEDYAKAQELTADNATGTVAMTALDNGCYWANIAGIAAKELDDTFYAAAVYTDANGNTYCTGVIAYSLSSYCMKNANGSMGELAQATAIYGYHANEYFDMEG